MPAIPAIPEFTDAELAAIREMLVQRYRKEVEVHLADSEVHLGADERDKHNPGTLNCPTVYWHERGANFVVVKCGAAASAPSFSIPRTTSSAPASSNTTTSTNASPQCCKPSPTMNGSARTGTRMDTLKS